MKALDIMKVSKHIFLNVFFTKREFKIIILKYLQVIILIIDKVFTVSAKIQKINQFICGANCKRIFRS